MTIPPVTYLADETEKNFRSDPKLLPLRDTMQKEQTVRIKDGFYSKGFRGNRNSAFLNASKQAYHTK